MIENKFSAQLSWILYQIFNQTLGIKKSPTNNKTAIPNNRTNKQQNSSKQQQ